MFRRVFGSLCLAAAPAALFVALSAPRVTSGAAPSAPSEMTIVYVDVDKVISDVDEGKVAQAALVKEQTARQAKITALETKLKKLQERVQALAGKGNTPALQQVGAEYQQVAAEYQQLIQQSQKEMVDKERELFDPIERKVKDVLRAISVKDGVDVVLSKRAISYARKDLDVTDRVTQEYNKLHPAAAAKPAEAPKPAASASAAPAASAAKPAAPAASAAKPAPAASAAKPAPPAASPKK
ncbi:MAG: OmpH family outer membrane protein [Deltaproteobacteria bacterium]|nr:OmpH family outer membrane protein [Deltaproteobacteria bacterium]